MRLPWQKNEEDVVADEIAKLPLDDLPAGYKDGDDRKAGAGGAE